MWFRQMTIAIALAVATGVAAFFLWDRVSAGAGTVTIGHVAPLTGDAAVWGVWEREGIDLAVDEINRQGGIGGRRLAVLHEDDQGEARLSVSALQNLITAKDVHIVIGGTLSGTTLAMAPLATRNKVVLLSPSAQSPKISQAGPYVFRIFASTAVEGAYLAEMVVASHPRSAAILYLNNDYGGGLNQTVSGILSSRMRIVADEAYSGDTRDFRTHIQKIVGEEAPDAVILLGYQTDVATIVKQMAEMGVKVRVFAPNSFEGDETVKIAGAAAEGVVYDYPVIPDGEYAARVRNAFKLRYGRDMNVYNGVGYDAIKLLASAIDKTSAGGKAVDSTAVMDALHRVAGFAGVTGPITIGANGDVVARPFEARTYRHGKFIKLGN